MGNLTGKAFPGVGNLIFVWEGWGKLNLECQFPFFLSGAEEELEEFRGKDFAFVSEWLTKSCIAFLKICMKSREYLNVNDFRFY